jgi:hypothetical protein
MARQKSLEKEKQWREIFQRQVSSGLSVRRFCADEGISEPSFYAWRKKLRERSDEEALSRRPSRCGAEAPDNTESFVPLKLVETASSLEIVHPLGYRIQVNGDVNPVALRQVLETLDERGVR